MEYRRKLMTGLIGLALLAAPITAAAKDSDNGKDNSRQSQLQNNASPSHSVSAPAHSNAPARNAAPAMIAPAHNAAPATMTKHEFRDQRADRTNAAPATMTRHEFRDQRANRTFNAAPAVTAPTMTRHELREQRADRTFNAAPAVTTRRDWRADRREDRRADRREDRREVRNDQNGWRHDRRDYDYDNDRRWGPYYTGGPYCVMPQGYAGGACAWARHLRRVYFYDRNTGHPAAAADLLPRLRRAERACGVHYGYNSYRYYY